MSHINSENEGRGPTRIEGLEEEEEVRGFFVIRVEKVEDRGSSFFWPRRSKRGVSLYSGPEDRRTFLLRRVICYQESRPSLSDFCPIFEPLFVPDRRREVFRSSGLFFEDGEILRRWGQLSSGSGERRIIILCFFLQTEDRRTTHLQFRNRKIEESPIYDLWSRRS